MPRLVTKRALAGMTVLAVAAVSIAAPALAQADLRALRERNVILQQQDNDRQNAMAAQREAVAARSRYEAQATLRSLDEAREAPAAPTLRPTLSPIPPRGPSADDLAADIERMQRLTDERLAESNARLRAVKPAS